MNIGLVGGIFSKDKELQEKLKSVPEKTLFDAFSKNGHQVYSYSSSTKPRGIVDFFHTHHFSYASFYLALTKERPMVFTSHNGFLLCNYTSRQTSILKRIAHVVFNNADALVALSKRESEVFQRDFGVPPEKITIIPNGLDLDLYKRPNNFSQPNKGAIRLLCVSHLDEAKGIEYLLIALRELKTEYPDIELKLVSYYQPLRQRYENLCSTYALARNVKFISTISTEQLVDLYYSCDIYVHPSLAEDLPTSITEAMVCGRPIIATNVGGTPEQVTEQTGILVKPKDAEGLAKAIKTLVENEALRSSMGRHGKEYAEKYFNKDTMYQKHLELYQEVLDGKLRSKNNSHSFKYLPYRVALEGYYHLSKVIDINRWLR